MTVNQLELFFTTLRRRRYRFVNKSLPVLQENRGRRKKVRRLYYDYYGEMEIYENSFFLSKRCPLAIIHYNYIPTYVYIKYNDRNASNVDPLPSIPYIINAVILFTEWHHVNK